METIIVEVFIPAITKSFDFRLPTSGRVCDITDELIRILEITQNNLMFDKTTPMLCDIENGVVLNPSSYIAQTGLHDSSRLILV